MIFEVLVARAMDRMAKLAHPSSGEPSPVVTGASPQRWAELAGLASTPHELLFPLSTIVMRDYEPAEVARAALQRLAALGLVEGNPRFYRPVRVASRGSRAGTPPSPLT